MKGESALDRAIPLMKPEVEATSHPREEGYLDLIGAQPQQSAPAQKFMTVPVIAKVYEGVWRPALGRVAKGLLGPSMTHEHQIARLLLALIPGDGVLDVGCGPGNFSRDYAKVVGHEGLVVGVDVSEPMLKEAVEKAAKEAAGNLAFVRASALELPFRDSSFDAVSCFAVLPLVTGPMRAIDEMVRVLAPGGRIALFASARAKTPLLRAVEDVIAKQGEINLFEQEELKDALADRGLTDIRQKVSGVTQFVGARKPE